VHEQKVYYHIKRLEKAGLVSVVRREQHHGAVAKFYTLTKPAFVLRTKPLEKSRRFAEILPEQKEFLEPFIFEGKLNSLIIVGSPDPHGPERARARDGYYGIDLALFLGTFLIREPMPRVKLDTEVRSRDLHKNLILIGGPTVNCITEKVNNKLPIFFDYKDNRNVHSRISGNVYPAEETGIIVKAKNPFDKNHRVLVIAGKRYPGTKAAIIAFLQGFDQICAGNSHNPKIKAKVVEGIDLDSDGIVDAVEFRE
jgi:hypothetical protein